MGGGREGGRRGGGSRRELGRDTYVRAFEGDNTQPIVESAGECYTLDLLIE